MAKRGRKPIQRFDEKQQRYIIKNYRKKTLKKIAEDLDVPVKWLYDYSRKHRLKKCRPWTSKEEQFLEDSIGRKRTKVIAKDLQRTVQAVQTKARQMGLSLNDDQPKLKTICKQVGMDPSCAYRAVKDGLLETHGKLVGGHRNLIVDIDDIREWVVNHQYKRTLKCYECGTEVDGDIYCDEHRPYYMSPKTDPIYRHIVRADGVYEDVLENLLHTLKKIRNNEDLKQQTVSQRACYTYDWYGTIERGHRYNITIEDLMRISDALGYELKFELERK